MIRQSDGVTLAAIISPDNIVFLEPGISKEESVRLMAEKMLGQLGGIITHKALFDRLTEVEKLNQVLESGFYIPHAKFPELDGFHGVLGVSREGFADQASGLRVKVALLLLSPHKPAFFQRHLNILSLLSQTFQPALIDKLAGLTDPTAVVSAILKP